MLMRLYAINRVFQSLKPLNRAAFVKSVKSRPLFLLPMILLPNPSFKDIVAVVSQKVGSSRLIIQD